MNFKIYEKNDLNKYLNHNEDFKNGSFPDYINSSLNNKIIPKKSFQPDEDTFMNMNNISNYNSLNNSNLNNKINFSPSKNNYISINPSYDQNLPNSPYNNNHRIYNLNFNKISSNPKNNFSEFLEKKNIYDRLSNLKESIGKRKINAPYISSVSKELNKSDIFNKISGISPKDYFVQSPRKLKSFVNLTHKTSLDAALEDLTKLKNYKLSNNKKENNDLLKLNDKGISLNDSKISNLNLFRNKKYDKEYNENTRISDGLNLTRGKSSNNFSSKTNINNISFSSINNKNDNKDVSKVNILYKIEQYKDYFKFKGL